MGRRGRSFSSQLSCLFCPAWGCTAGSQDEDEREDSRDSISPRTSVSSSSPTAAEHEEWKFHSGGVDVNRVCNLDQPLHPSEARKRLDDLLLLCRDNRYLHGLRLLERLEKCLASSDTWEGRWRDHIYQVERIMKTPEVAKRLNLLRQRGMECRQAINDLQEDDDWIFAQSMWGTETYYRPNPDGTIKVKVLGKIASDQLMDQLAVLREGDLYREWVPFVHKSALCKQTKLELCTWFCMDLPVIMISRDVCLHVYACDAAEDGIILFVGNSVENEDTEEEGTYLHGVKLPDKPSGWGGDRMLMKDFRFELRILDQHAAGVYFTSTFEPKISLPQSLQNFFVKKIAGMVLVFLRRQALRVRQECDHHPIAMRIRTDPFYSHYLLPRFEDYYALRGWEFPNVGALGWIRSRRCVGSADNTTTTSRGRTRSRTSSSGSTQLNGGHDAVYEDDRHWSGDSEESLGADMSMSITTSQTSSLGIRSLDVAALTIVMACLGPWIAMAVEHMGMSSLYRPLLRHLPTYTTNQTILLLVWASTRRFIEAQKEQGSLPYISLLLKAITTLAFLATLVGCTGWLAPLFKKGVQLPHVVESWSSCRIADWSLSYDSLFSLLAFGCDTLVTVWSVWYMINEGYSEGVGWLWRNSFLGDKVADRILERSSAHDAVSAGVYRHQ